MIARRLQLAVNRTAAEYAYMAAGIAAQAAAAGLAA